MPIIRAGAQLLYYAHVPKCGGSAIETYLEDRFGKIAFVDKHHHRVPLERRWSRTSPQHVSLQVLDRLFPQDFFDASFAVVRHPVARIVSAYHFQLEIEHSEPANISFPFWLERLADTMADDPFVYDNHTRPMAELVPQDAKVFHLEHGLDAMVPWLDNLLGSASGPRAIARVNARKGRGGGQKVSPSKTDIDLIAELYAQDFERFGYVPDQKAPLHDAPVLSPDFVIARDAELARINTTTARASVWLRDRLIRVTR